MQADFVLGLGYGDEAKAKVTYHLLQQNKYDLVSKTGGSANCGHSFYHHGRKIITHQIPIGVAFGIRSLIPPACVVDVQKFFNEIEDLKKFDIQAEKLVKIDRRCHIITEKHLEEDGKDSVIGTTKCGVGPCVSDKYRRTGIPASEISELKPFLTDSYEEFFAFKDLEVLFEGSQGFYLDPHFGEYPYVTSTHCTLAGALLNGVSISSVRRVYGVEKAYQTYVGKKKFEPDEEIFRQIRELGQEYGATTGRPRQCNYLNIDNLKKAIIVNSVTDLVISKMDIFRQLNCWKVLQNDKVVNLETEENFKDKIAEVAGENVKLYFSYTPESI